MKKLKLVYDATLIRFGAWNNGSRSGIYCVAINILKELVKRNDVDLTLFCNPLAYHELKCALSKEIPEVDFIIKTDHLLTPYGRLQMIKRRLKLEHKTRLKFFLHVFLFVLSPLVKLAARLRKSLTFRNYDAFFSPARLISSEIATKNKYVIIHDLIPLLRPEYSPKNWDWAFKLYETINSNDYYFTVSNYTKKDCLENFRQIDPQKIRTILLACDEKFHPYTKNIDKVKAKYGIPLDKKYIFSLCTLDPRKNLIRIVKTFVEFIKKNNINDFVLILGGGYWENFIKKFEQTVGNLGDFKDKVIHIGYVDDKELPILYSGAEWFVYTSAYEGFGLPPLESMSCGCPVITSNNTSLPEVVGDAGIMIDWNSDEQHIQAYEKYYFDENLRKENSRKGLLRAKTFSWTKCTDQIVKNIVKDLKEKNNTTDH